MPFVEEESLRQRLDRERQLPLENALRIWAEPPILLSRHSPGPGTPPGHARSPASLTSGTGEPADTKSEDQLVISRRIRRPTESRRVPSDSRVR